MKCGTWPITTRRPLLTLACCLLLAAGPTEPAIYTNDFAKAAVGKVPDDIMVLDGGFAVREFDGNKCLELSPDPIGSYGCLFGPEGLAAMEVRARIWAAPRGKRFPEFGIGAGGIGGYKLILCPARAMLELRKGDDVVMSVPFKWTAAGWTWFQLQVEPNDKGGWLARGRAWAEGQKQPREWMLLRQDAQMPSDGRASLWGDDFSEQPIRFDDLSVSSISVAKS